MNGTKNPTAPDGRKSPQYGNSPHAKRAVAGEEKLNLKATISCSFDEAITTWAAERARDLKRAQDTITSVRRFFNEFIQMAQECRRSKGNELPADISIRLKMMIPRALYARTRSNKPISHELAQLIIMLVNYSTTPAQLVQARHIFEAVLGYAVNEGLRNR